MATATSSQIAAFLSSSSSTFHTRSFYSSHTSLRTTNSTFPSFSPTSITPSKKFTLFRHPSQTKSILWHIPAATAKNTAVEAAVDATEQLVSSTDDGGASVVVSALFFAAFIGLSVITIGVIYIAVADFLQKREKEKFEKEEAAKSGKKKKKKVVRRAGPKGFGQKKVDEIEDDDY